MSKSCSSKRKRTSHFIAKHFNFLQKVVSIIFFDKKNLNRSDTATKTSKLLVFFPGKDSFSPGRKKRTRELEAWLDTSDKDVRIRAEARKSKVPQTEVRHWAPAGRYEASSWSVRRAWRIWSGHRLGSSILSS